MNRPQPGHRDMGVELGGRQAGVAEKFLHHAQVGAAFEEVGGRTVAQTVRPDVGGAVHGRHGLVHDGAGLPRIESTTAGTQQQGGAGVGRRQGRTAGLAPNERARSVFRKS